MGDAIFALANGGRTTVDPFTAAVNGRPILRRRKKAKAVPRYVVRGNAIQQYGLRVVARFQYDSCGKLHLKNPTQ